jgi:hypothetical protein
MVRKTRFVQSTHLGRESLILHALVQLTGNGNSHPRLVHLLYDYALESLKIGSEGSSVVDGDRIMRVLIHHDVSEVTISVIARDVHLCDTFPIGHVDSHWHLLVFYLA